MKIRNTVLALALAAVPFGALADTMDEDRVKELVLEAIRENPQIVMEAVEILQRRDAEAQAERQAETLTNQRLLLEQDPNAPVLGNPDGDVTVIEFFDYNCPYCRQAMSEVQGLLDADPNVRLVYREWPILGDGSVFAARAALASRNQGKYEEFHWALMGMDGRAEEASVMRIANQVGLDIDQLLNDMENAEIDAHLAESTRLSQALGFNGTPSFVVGDELLPGFVEEALLLEVVQKTRDEGQ
ncbi:MAG: protein-disulfide isomerase [Paracoccaceae bacterium]|jgi:protein-disulfide isomerase